MIRIYADFNCIDEEKRVVLNTAGSLADIHRRAEELVEGMRVVLYMTDEFEVEGVLEFDGVWCAVPDWATIKYYDSASPK